MFFYTQSREYRVEIDIHGCYSLAKIAFAPIWACKNNRRIWRHDTSTLRSRDVTYQLSWRHKVKSEKNAIELNGEMRIVCSGHKIAWKK